MSLMWIVLSVKIVINFQHEHNYRDSMETLCHLTHNSVSTKRVAFMSFKTILKSERRLKKLTVSATKPTKITIRKLNPVVLLQTRIWNME